VSELFDQWLSALSNSSEVSELIVGEEFTDDEQRFIKLAQTEDGLELRKDKTNSLALPLPFLKAVMQRYARPLSDVGRLKTHLRLSDQGVLAHMHYLPRFEVVPKDYLVWAQDGQEPIGELCAMLLPPLCHLASVLKSKSESLH